MEKLLGKREKIFALITLAIINILCVVKFLITFVKECNLINQLMKIEDSIFYTGLGELTYAKVFMIICICFAIALFLYSFSFLFIKNKLVKRNLMIISFTIVFLIIMYYFVSRYTCGDFYSKDIFLDDGTKQYVYSFAYEFHKNAIFMLVSVVISLICCFLNFSISNDVFDKNINDSNYNVDETNQQKTKEEEILSDEIEKLKTRLRIKDLESEYLSLKSKLDEK